MAVFRIEKTKDFTIMSNHHLRNIKLSLKAKGLLSLNFNIAKFDNTKDGLLQAQEWLSNESKRYTKQYN